MQSQSNGNTWVYAYDAGGSSMRSLLGGKGAELAEMSNAGLPVPPGFTVTTDACREFYRLDGQLPSGLMDQIRGQIEALGTSTGRAFGDSSNPLLVSVRSGAVVSMPGMMETILNVGINDEVAIGMGRATGNERFALDLLRRFIQMYANVVMGMSIQPFEEALESAREAAGASQTSDLNANQLRSVIEGFRSLVASSDLGTVPEDPFDQLEGAVRAVFSSWNTRRAVDYRNYHRIPHDLGTAVNIVSMVYGNVDDNSATGVLFTRDPGTGEKALYGEYLINAQGEDVVSGVATPMPIQRLESHMPQVYGQIVEAADRLERHYSDVQDVEFTVEQGRLWVLQTRTGQRSAQAAVRTAVEMADEGLITREQALTRVTVDQVSQLLLPRLDDNAKLAAERDGRVVTIGLGASPGGANGEAVFDADTAEEWAKAGRTVVLIRPETSAQDVHGMLVAEGIITARGGVTSHAAVVARGVGKPCVTGAEEITVDLSERALRCGDTILHEGDEVSLDGGTGQVFAGHIDTVQTTVAEQGELSTLLSWADDARRLGVRANADSPSDATRAIELGAEGIGLCRSEHMFFQPHRLDAVRRMVLSAYASNRHLEDEAILQEYRDALAEVEEFQVEDYVAIFKELDGRPFTVRLLDPPLHEFLPQDWSDADGEDGTQSAVAALRSEALEHMQEDNPMLGLRGCRLAVVYPEIYEVQVKAMVRATKAARDEGVPTHLEIMVPLVAHAAELDLVKSQIKTVLEISDDENIRIGAMIEVPRAALTSDEIAQRADFLSYGTNDLTQTTLALSRDDAEGEFLPEYVQKGIMRSNPFQELDREGVGELINISQRLSREASPLTELGVCGEHGGDPSSIEFFNSVGLDYVSCSPFRVPGARLAAAQSAISQMEG